MEVNNPEMDEMRNVVATLQNTIQQIQIQLQQVNISNHMQQTQMTPVEIRKTFRDIPVFSGEDKYRLSTFLRNVQAAESNCTSQQLQVQCLQKVINERITGRAQNVISRLSPSERTWENVKEALKAEFRPPGDITDMLYEAKYTKVQTIKDLLSKLRHVESKCIEIMDFDGHETYNHNLLNRDLVKIFIKKLNPIQQQLIDQNSTLCEIHRKMSSLDVYTDENAIDQKHKINKPFKPTHAYVQRNNSNHDNSQHKQNQNKSYNQTKSDYKPNPRSYNRNPNGYTNNYNNANQSTSQVNNNNSNTHTPTPMEVDSIQNRNQSSNNQDVNFCQKSGNPPCP